MWFRAEFDFQMAKQAKFWTLFRKIMVLHFQIVLENTRRLGQLLRISSITFSSKCEKFCPPTDEKMQIHKMLRFHKFSSVLNPRKAFYEVYVKLSFFFCTTNFITRTWINRAEHLDNFHFFFLRPFVGIQGRTLGNVEKEKEEQLQEKSHTQSWWWVSEAFSTKSPKTHFFRTSTFQKGLLLCG